MSARYLGRPSSFATRLVFTSEEKIYLLKQWEGDLRLLMVASEENMTGTSPGRTAELLQIVHQKLNDLGAMKEQPAAVNKAGGVS